MNRHQGRIRYVYLPFRIREVIWPSLLWYCWVILSGTCPLRRYILLLYILQLGLGFLFPAYNITFGFSSWGLPSSHSELSRAYWHWGIYPFACSSQSIWGDLTKSVFIFQPLNGLVGFEGEQIQRYHESLNNRTPGDVYAGRDKQILDKREEIKRRTLRLRRVQNREAAPTETTN